MYCPSDDSVNFYDLNKIPSFCCVKRSPIIEYLFKKTGNKEILKVDEDYHRSTCRYETIMVKDKR